MPKSSGNLDVLLNGFDDSYIVAFEQEISKESGHSVLEVVLLQLCSYYVVCTYMS